MGFIDRVRGNVGDISYGITAFTASSIAVQQLDNQISTVQNMNQAERVDEVMRQSVLSGFYVGVALYSGVRAVKRFVTENHVQYPTERLVMDLACSFMHLTTGGIHFLLAFTAKKYLLSPDSKK